MATAVDIPSSCSPFSPRVISSSSSTGAGTNEDAAALGLAKYLLGSYGGGGGVKCEGGGYIKTHKKRRSSKGRGEELFVQIQSRGER